MSQNDVYLWLKVQRQTGSEKFFTVKEISKGLQEQEAQGFTESIVRRDALTLRRLGFLETPEVDVWREWRVSFRLKREYL